MNKSRHLLLMTHLALCLVLLVGCQGQQELTLASSAEKPTPALPEAIRKQTRAAAVAVLGSLSEEQRKKAVRKIADPLRKDWHFVPRARQGVMLGELNTAQKTLVHKLLQTALSDSGYLKATDIIWLESVLYEMSNKNPMRDPGKYALLIFGDPADAKSAWGWRLEGHHLSINLTYTADSIGVTPLFFGTNPAVVPVGPLAGKRVLADAHNLAVQLAASMNDEQKKKMMLASKPRDVITGPGREASLKKVLGVAGDDLTGDQKVMLLSLAAKHWSSYENGHLSELIRRSIQLTVDDIAPTNLLHFAWAGPIDVDQPFYYRIQSKKFLVEYSCQGKNHVHAVIHDLTDPLQDDLLKKHFEQHKH